MLTRDLLRYKFDGDRVLPSLLRPTPGMLELAQRLLDYWRAGVGRCQGELDEGAQRLCHGARSAVVARGMQKLLVDACRWAEVPDQAERRWSVLAASARMLVQQPATTAEDHRAGVAALLETSGEGPMPEDLYADLPQAAVLEEAPGWTAAALLDRYNLALVQGLLLSANALDVFLTTADAGRRRQVLKALRFQRLLATATQRDDGLHLEVSGPGSVLDQATRYGLQLANFLPTVVAGGAWRIRAQVRPDRRGPPATLELDQQSGLSADSRFLAYLPEELRDLVERLAARRPDWQCTPDAPLSPLPGTGELIVPDLAITLPDGRRCDLELFHRWHHTACARRLQQLAAGQAPHLLIGLDRSIAGHAGLKELVAGPLFAARGFLFSAFPSPTVIAKAVEVWAAT